MSRGFVYVEYDVFVPKPKLVCKVFDSPVPISPVTPLSPVSPVVLKPVLVNPPVKPLSPVVPLRRLLKPVVPVLPNTVDKPVVPVPLKKLLKPVTPVAVPTVGNVYEAAPGAPLSPNV